MQFVRNILLPLVLCSILFAGCATKHEDLTIIHQEAYQAYQAKDYITAATMFEILVSRIPKDSELWFRLGNSYARSMRPQEAIEAYQNSLLRNPKNGKAWYNMGVVQMEMAVKSFADMQAYLEPDDPISLKGKTLMDGLFELLGPDYGYDIQSPAQ